MPSGIVLQSYSVGATQEALEKVLADNGHEVEKPAVAAAEELAEPKRDDFKSDEEFEAAQEEFETKQEEAAAAAEEKEEQEREKAEAKKERENGRNKPSRKQRAIDKATRELKEKNQQLEERLAALEGKKPVAAAPKLEVPKREDFKSDQEFDDAMFDYRYKQRRAKEDSENAQKAQQDRMKETFENYQTSVAAFKEEHDDWDEVVGQKIPIHESVYLTIMELENGPQVTYYLGKHPDTARRLAELSPLSAVVEVGKLADKLANGQKPDEKRTATKIPPKAIPEPVRPVSTSASASTITSREAAQKRDYKAFKQAQRKGA